MKHLGDITKINGWEVPIVDVVTGGSPCQDLSVAGKRAGLAGERSGLFMEQIRIIKEMREHDISANDHRGLDIRPRYMVWENVTGALSSNNGEDFRCVLEETCRIAEKGVSVPGLAKGEKWGNAGAICGDGWSVAWRVTDAQYHGVPQRRKRVCVLADFNGYTAAELLFERFRETGTDGCYEVIGYTRGEPESEVQPVCESVSGDSETSFKKGEEVAGTVGESSDVSSISFLERAGKRGGARASLSNENVSEPCQPLTTKVCYGISAYESNAMKSGNPHSGVYEASVPRTLDLNGGSPACNQGGICVTEPKYGVDCYNGAESKEQTMTLTGVATDPHHVPCTYQKITGTLNPGAHAGQNNTVSGDTPLVCEGVVSVSHGGFMVNADDSGIAHTLQATDYKDPPVACFAINAHSAGVTENVSQTLLGEKNDNHHPCVYGQSSFGQYTDGCGTLKANGGDIGGGSETLVIQ